MKPQHPRSYPMPIAFRDAADQEALGLAAYIRIIDAGERSLKAALFFVNARGEPVEFTFNAVEVPTHFLWRPGDARRSAVAALCRSLFQAATKTPALLLARAEEVPPRVFGEDLIVPLPLCRVARGDAVQAATEIPEPLTEDTHLYWVGEAPAEGTAARHLLSALASKDLLLEPFDRAELGLTEAFAET